MPDIYSAIGCHIADLLLKVERSVDRGICNLPTPHLALLLVYSGKPFLVVENSAEAASALYHDVQFFRRIFPNKSEGHAVHIPPSVGTDSVGERARAVFEIHAHPVAGVVTSLDARLTGFDLGHIGDKVVTLRKGLSLSRDSLDRLLAGLGYRKVSVVADRGEYSERQWVFDIYPSTDDLPVRIEFFGDEIDLMRTFDIETQRTIAERNEAIVLPAEEGEAIHDIVEDVMSRRETVLFWAAAEKMTGDAQGVRGHTVISVSHLPFMGCGIDAGALPLKGLGIAPEERRSFDDVVSAIRNLQDSVVVVVPSHAQADRFREILLNGGMIAPIVDHDQVAGYEGRLCITIGTLSSGLRLPGAVILTDREIFGERPSYRALKRSRVSRLLLSLDDMKEGDFVVHKDHGIGRFVAVERLKAGGREEDFVVLEYARGDRLLIPFLGLERLQKYRAGEGHTPSVDRLGGRTWQRTKQKVKNAVKEMAERLLRLYAARRTARGFTFSEDTALHDEFDSFFPYEETPDQAKAADEILRHMRSDNPMDMLLCGDVGYGKTEVAMRAAFRSVYDGKQVAVLVPTTLLAEQHFRTFKTRFSGFPVTIDSLSRFKKREDVRRTLIALARGEIDIMIGTHMLLGKDVAFRDLGLLIIDEEHRFGVAQKERLKELSSGVDVLTLTATPIPRTLHMSLSGIRELCTIETPPEERLAVRSMVTTTSDRVLKEAIDRELKRGGQVFFVHNRVSDLEKVALRILRLVPAARLSVAHGQMRERQLEKIMIDFLDGKTDVLVCTSIIGSGLDIPTANTIIVDRADQFGLSDLYQLRGRVGRGNMQAYAYFLMPGENLLTDDAKKRLQAVQEMSYLGAGFRLALKDLEIRGAGNLLGSEQSGHVYKVGFEMYLDMLEKAVAELKGEEKAEEVDPQIRLDIAAFIPEPYVPDAGLRLGLYRRLASEKTVEALRGFREELLDRFGPVPEEADNLLQVMRVRVLARQLYLERVQGFDGKCRFSLVSDPEGKYGMPEGFPDRLLNSLFSVQASSGSGEQSRIRLLPDGFELDTMSASPRDALLSIQRTLETLCGRMSDHT